METLQSLLSRKFILAVLILVAGFVTVLTGETTYQEFQSLAVWMMGIYTAGNVTSKLELLNK